MTIKMVREELQRGSESGELKRGSRPCNVIHCTNRATKWVSIASWIEMRRYYCSECEKKARE